MDTQSCFICNNASTVINDITRKRYRDVIGLDLSPKLELCYICRHLLNKFWNFKSLCLSRSVDYTSLYDNDLQSNFLKTDINIETITQENDEDDFQNDEIINYESNDDLNLNDTNDNDGHDQLDNTTEELNTDVCDRKINVEKIKKKDRKKRRHFEKIVLNMEQQKAGLEAKRREKKYLEAEFKCYNCALSFLFKDTYQAHMMRHEESNGEYQCTICSLRFATAAILRVHKSNHSVMYKCVKCSKIVGLRGKRGHEIKCYNLQIDKFACHLCGNIYKAPSDLQQHIRRSHSVKNTNRSYSCNICGKTYEKQASVRYHMLAHVKRKFKCELCPSIYNSPFTLNQHMKKHTQTDKELYYCTTCKTSYRTRKSLLAHLRLAVVHKSEPVQCPLCSVTCANQRSLSMHTNRVHAPMKTYECKSCPSCYTTRKSLLNHIRVKHVNGGVVKNKLCQICGAKFQSKSKLNRHLEKVCEKNKEDDLSIYTNQIL